MSQAAGWLHAIPREWQRKKLKYVASLKSGNSITSDDIAESGEYPVFGGNGIRGYASAYTHEGRHVLIGRQGALCGNINYATGRFWASEHAVVVTINADSNVTWLGELLRSMNLNQYSQSAAQPGLAVDVIANLEISSSTASAATSHRRLPRPRDGTAGCAGDSEGASARSVIGEAPGAYHPRYHARPRSPRPPPRIRHPLARQDSGALEDRTIEMAFP